jgi:hypothetical protein
MFGFGQRFPQAGTQLLQTVAVTAGGGVRRKFQQGGDLLEGVAVPQLQDDHLALLRRQGGQAAHRGALPGRLVRRPLKPAAGFKLPGHAAPQGSPVV